MFLQTEGGLCGNGLTADTWSWAQMSRVQLPWRLHGSFWALMQGPPSAGNTTSLVFADLRPSASIGDWLHWEASTHSKHLRPTGEAKKTRLFWVMSQSYRSLNKRCPGTRWDSLASSASSESRLLSNNSPLSNSSHLVVFVRMTLIPAVMFLSTRFDMQPTCAGMRVGVFKLAAM